MKKPFVTKEQIEEIVKTYPTPFHIYDEKGIRENQKQQASIHLMKMKQMHHQLTLGTEIMGNYGL